MSMNCGADGCTGGHWKYASCLDEAVAMLSMDGADRETGSVDYRGFFALVVVVKDEDKALESGQIVTVPVGCYIFHEIDSGATSVTLYDSRTQADAVMSNESDLYAAWLGEDDD